jgi:hypothetical protein
MSTPRATAFCFISSIVANRYGGKVLIRLEGSIGNPAMKRRSFLPVGDVELTGYCMG